MQSISVVGWCRLHASIGAAFSKSVDLRSLALLNFCGWIVMEEQHWMCALQAAPTILKSTFLEPISGGLASELSLGLFACTDKDFMQMFAGELASRSTTAHQSSFFCTKF